jgi:hypothetical protein
MKVDDYLSQLLILKQPFHIYSFLYFTWQLDKRTEAVEVYPSRYETCRKLVTMQTFDELALKKRRLAPDGEENVTINVLLFVLSWGFTWIFVEHRV